MYDMSHHRSWKLILVKLPLCAQTQEVKIPVALRMRKRKSKIILQSLFCFLSSKRRGSKYLPSIIAIKLRLCATTRQPTSFSITLFTRLLQRHLVQSYMDAYTTEPQLTTILTTGRRTEQSLLTWRTRGRSQS